MDYYEKTENPYQSRQIIEGDSRFINIFEVINTNLEIGSTILDIGCGDLAIKNYLQNYKVFGIDVDKRFTNNVDIINHNLETVPYPFKENNFDCVICSEVLEHLFYPEKVIQESYRVLKQGGILIITVPNYDSVDNLLNKHRISVYDKDNIFSVEHIRNYNLDSIFKLVKGGFDILTVKGNSPHMSNFFKDSRIVLGNFLAGHIKEVDSLMVDQLLGKMFIKDCPGILVAGVKRNT
jgi:SAM-dependent methyltransferase